MANGEPHKLDECAQDAGNSGAGRIALRLLSDYCRVGADGAVVRFSAEIDRQVRAGAKAVVVGIGAREARARIREVVLGLVAGAVDVICAQVSGNLEAGIGAGDVVEARSEDVADFHVFNRLHDRLSCGRKFDSLCGLDCEQYRCAAEPGGLVGKAPAPGRSPSARVAEHWRFWSSCWERLGILSAPRHSPERAPRTGTLSYEALGFEMSSEENY